MTEQSIQITSIQNLKLYENGKETPLSNDCRQALQVDPTLIETITKLVQQALASSTNPPKELRVRITQDRVTILSSGKELASQSPATTQPVFEHVQRIKKLGETLRTRPGASQDKTIEEVPPNYELKKALREKLQQTLAAIKTAPKLDDGVKDRVILHVQWIWQSSPAEALEADEHLQTLLEAIVGHVNNPPQNNQPLSPNISDNQPPLKGVLATHISGLQAQSSLPPIYQVLSGEDPIPTLVNLIYELMCEQAGSSTPPTPRVLTRQYTDEGIARTTVAYTDTDTTKASQKRAADKHQLIEQLRLAQYIPKYSELCEQELQRRLGGEVTSADAEEHAWRLLFRHVTQPINSAESPGCEEKFMQQTLEERGTWICSFKTLPSIPVPNLEQIADALKIDPSILREIAREQLQIERGRDLYDASPEKKRQKRLKQIAFSAVEQRDFTSTIDIQSEALRQQLGLQPDQTITTTTELSHNSPLNGYAYRDASDREVVVTSAIASSNDRKTPQIHNLRRLADSDDKTIGYTGRVENEEKAIEQATFLFRKEKARLTRAKEIYQMPYVVFSALGSSRLLSSKERALLDSEQKALQSAFKQLITIDGCSVQVTPILIHRHFNHLEAVDQVLDRLPGSSHSDGILTSAINGLQTLAQQCSNPEAQQCLNILSKNKHLLPEEELLYVAHICDLLRIPIVYHCKSSTDRTGSMLAIAAALRQWKNLGQSLPPHLPDLLKRLEFKELFAANLLAGHPITEMGRGILGYKIATHPPLQRLLPARYLVPAPRPQRILCGLLRALTGNRAAIPSTVIDKTSPLVAERHLLHRESKLPHLIRSTSSEAAQRLSDYLRTPTSQSLTSSDQSRLRKIAAHWDEIQDLVRSQALMAAYTKEQQALLQACTTSPRAIFAFQQALSPSRYTEALSAMQRSLQQPIEKHENPSGNPIWVDNIQRPPHIQSIQIEKCTSESTTTTSCSLEKIRTQAMQHARLNTDSLDQASDDQITQATSYWQTQVAEQLGMQTDNPLLSAITPLLDQRTFVHVVPSLHLSSHDMLSTKPSKMGATLRFVSDDEVRMTHHYHNHIVKTGNGNYGTVTYEVAFCLRKVNEQWTVECPTMSRPQFRPTDDRIWLESTTSS